MSKTFDGVITVHCGQCGKEAHYPLYAIKDTDEVPNSTISSIYIDFATCVILWNCPLCDKANKMHFSPEATHSRTGAHFPRIKTM